MYAHVLTPSPDFHMGLQMLKGNVELGAFYELLMSKTVGIKEQMQFNDINIVIIKFYSCKKVFFSSLQKEHVVL